MHTFSQENKVDHEKARHTFYLKPKGGACVCHAHTCQKMHAHTVNHVLRTIARAHTHADEGSEYEEKTFYYTFLPQRIAQNKNNSSEGLKIIDFETACATPLKDHEKKSLKQTFDGLVSPNAPNCHSEIGRQAQ